MWCMLRRMKMSTCYCNMDCSDLEIFPPISYQACQQSPLFYCRRDEVGGKWNRIITFIILTLSQKLKSVSSDWQVPQFSYFIRWSAFIYRIFTPTKVHLADITLGKSWIVIPFMVRGKQKKQTVQKQYIHRCKRDKEDKKGPNWQLVETLFKLSALAASTVHESPNKHIGLTTYWPISLEKIWIWFLIFYAYSVFLKLKRWCMRCSMW